MCLLLKAKHMPRFSRKLAMIKIITGYLGLVAVHCLSSLLRTFERPIEPLQRILLKLMIDSTFAIFLLEQALMRWLVHILKCASVCVASHKPNGCNYAHSKQERMIKAYRNVSHAGRSLGTTANWHSNGMAGSKPTRVLCMFQIHRSTRCRMEAGCHQ